LVDSSFSEIAFECLWAFPVSDFFGGFLPFQGRLWLAFDHTYLTPTLAQTRLKNTAALVGGCWEPGKEETCFLDLASDVINAKSIQRASTILECAVWDPTATKKVTLSAACMPMSHDFGSQQGGASKSGWVMAEALGRLLSNSQNTIQGVVFDAAGCHGIIRKVIHGHLLDVNVDTLASVPFFSDLRHQDLPRHRLPRLPIRLCFHEGEPFYGMVGPCSLDFKDANFIYLYQVFNKGAHILLLSVGLSECQHFLRVWKDALPIEN